MTDKNLALSSSLDVLMMLFTIVSLLEERIEYKEGEESKEKWMRLVEMEWKRIY